MAQATISNEETIKGKFDLFVRSWRGDGEARGVVVIVPGFNSHSAYYATVAERLVKSGLVVYAVDLRGRGRSDGERFYVEKFGDYVDDVKSVVTLAKTRDVDLPIFLLGHSAGGVVACLYALDHGTDLAGLISESFAFRIPAPDFALTLFKGLSHIAPHAHVLRLKNADFSRDPKAVRAMDDDALIAHETQPTQTLAEMVRADDRLKKELARIDLPVLILHRTKDKAAKPSGSQFFYDAARSRDKTLKMYEGSYHDPLHDLDKEVVTADIATWLTAHLVMDRAPIASARERV